ncbi:ABC transporter ATP-binding protein [Lederbergia citrea]|uniref:ABC transporter ATP-binding protein n=1 Tax=Lederbergia citrea TaxID=2833581 RepID=A0A942US89_9BACI|nr:ABC transporter ATP-binding protein [Lederbergia citrea]MBS4176758.1 ABC transporter ATP-binding protein [Lederbergia citrea]MBS4203319.1 ABC transporter ATP-binding protein [Lederbergia citrea]MBS4222009.1 ABC transporter ATP-binding protein [Lederbergia citrea]
MVKVLSYLKPYRLAMAVAWMLMLTELVVELWHPLFMAKIIDEGILKEDLNAVMYWGGIMVGMSMLGFIAGIINSFFSSHVSQSFSFDVRAALFKKVQSFSFNNLAHFQTSSLITRLTNDVTQVQNTVFMSLRVALRAPLLIIGGATMALFVNVKLALFLVFPIPILVVLLIWMMQRSGKLFRFVQDKLDKVNNVMQENLTGMRLIKAFIRKKFEEKRFNKANQELRDETVKALRLVELIGPILLFVMNIGILLILWFGAIEVNQKGMNVGEVVAIVNYGFRITSALSILTWITMAFSRGRASSQRISEVLATDVDLTNTAESSSDKTILEGTVDFNRVSFTYPGTNKPVLSNLSFVAESGQTVAVMGSTGSGKSALFQLIPRLYDVTNGTIKIDGIDIRKMTLETLRKQIGFVPQESILFTGSVTNNIAWGKEDASMEEIIESAKDAQIHETILKLPNKYDTKIGQKGVNLSGGQKQRLSIARALIRKPKLLFLDDSTSALDLKTEARLLSALEKYDCTTFIITQKVTTAMKADQILLLDDGKIIARGSHNNLMISSALYQDIYKSQFAKEGLADVQ